MAHLRKRNAKWYVRYTDENGKSKEKALSKDKAIARQMMANIVRDVERRKAGLADDFTQHARQPIAIYLSEYREELESRDRTWEHIENTLACCERIVSDCGFSRISDLDESRVKRWLKTRRESGLSVRSSNRYSTAIKSFARWLWVTRKTATHLLVGLKALNPDVDKRHERRALSDADFGKLLAATAASQRVDKGGSSEFTGLDRYHLYLTAALATSLSTGRAYQGINQLLLQVLAMKRGYQSKWFGTFQQIKAASASVRRGEKAVQVVLFRPVSRERTNENGEQVEDKFLVMRTFSVFNVEQTTGLDQFRVGFAQPSDTIFERFEAMDRLVAAVGIDLRHGGNKAFYSPGGDYIQMPHRHQFESSETYYQTLAHEMTHWSEKRIGFDRVKEENSYALGELVAELGASFLLAELGLPASENIDNCTRYLDHWLKAMKGDTRFIFKAAATASKAVDFLLSHVRQPEEQPVPAETEVGTC